MGSARGLANHSLYMARILLQAWQNALNADNGPEERVLDAAFGPAIRGHLLDGYGWFLLAMTRATTLPRVPPHHTEQLPQLGEGISEPGEVGEYRRLEQEGWLAQLQAPPPLGLARSLPGGTLASSHSAPGIATYQQWWEQLDGLFQRMADCMDEY